ncbi:hypothetical protein [Hymenobacter negativus]|uniref:Uncharacterized protein n=1 Tax=Hymenobacter negativus TaxID=2795026 RepID=A0ABS3QKW4_9BACT|nr:hypothetical protein [Hymenobacter negativus]MBO2011618.1 hypothetical protein [Hymenobacter negativus]
MTKSTRYIVYRAPSQGHTCVELNPLNTQTDKVMANQDFTATLVVS